MTFIMRYSSQSTQFALVNFHETQTLRASQVSMAACAASRRRRATKNFHLLQIHPRSLEFAGLEQQKQPFAPMHIAMYQTWLGQINQASPLPRFKSSRPAGTAGPTAKIHQFKNTFLFTEKISLSIFLFVSFQCICQTMQ